MSEPASSSKPAEPSAQNKKATNNANESIIMPVNTRSEFDEIVKSMKDTHLVVEFYAQWCGPCRGLAMKLQEVGEKYGDKVKIIKIDIEELEELAIEYDVTQMPAFMIMKNGKKLEQYSGSKPEKVDEMTNKYLETES